VTKREEVMNRKRLLSVFSSVMLLVSVLFIGISFHVPDTSAAAVTHNVGELQVNMLTDIGRIFLPLQWPQGGTFHTTNDATGYGFIGLVVDQDNYDHNPVSTDIADCYSMYPYLSSDDFIMVNPATMVIDDGTTEKSVASFQNTGTSIDADDLLINQTAWTVKNKDWAILQWTLVNLKGVDITGAAIGLEIPLSQVGAGYGLGGDSGDDIDGYDAVNDIYWAQDNGGTGTCIGFGSAIVSEPISHYFSQDYHPPTYDEYKTYWENETWLYERLHTPNSVVGALSGNRTSTVGYDGITIPTGSSRTFSLVIAINDTFGDMISAMKDAQNYYNTQISGFQITEISDASSLTQQVEIFNFGAKTVDMLAEGYFLSLDGITPLLGSWDKNPLPGYEYGVFTLSAGNIGPEGDTIGLYRDLGGGNIVLFDSVAFGYEGLAPDPLTGESVARRYDPVTTAYTNEWIRNASSGPTWGAQNDVIIINPNPQVVLNEVMFNPGNPQLGFIELMYLGLGSVDLQGYNLICDSEYKIQSSIVLSPSNRYFTLVFADDPAFFSQMDPPADNVYLYDNIGRLLDMVGWSSPHLQGMSVSRIPDGAGTFTGYDDPSSIACGWVFDNPLDVLLTEFSDDDSTPAQIEVFNPRYPLIDFSLSFNFESASSGPLSGVWTIPTADTNEYALFDLTLPGLDTEGDTISFFQNGILIESIAYGQNGAVPDPLLSESVQRIFEFGNYTDYWCRNLTIGPNFGLQNDVLPVNFSSDVLLNEVVFNSGMPEYRFIELIYVGSSNLDLFGYKIVCDTEHMILSGNVMTPSNNYIILSQPDNPGFFTQVDTAGDNIYLYDNSGRLLDMVGWNSPHNVNCSALRVPEGSGSRQGYDDITSQIAGWVFDQIPTLPFSSIESNQFQIGVAGMTLTFYLNVSNLNNLDDVIDISYTSIKGWTVELLQSDGVTLLTDTETGPSMDGIPDTGIIAPNSTVQISVNVTIPFGIPGGVTELTTIYARSSLNFMASDSVLLNSTTLMGLEYRSPNRYVTFVRGTLMVIGHVDNTQVTVTHLSFGTSIAQFTVNEGESWTTSLTDAHVDINATYNATVLSGNSIYAASGNSWMSYIPTEGGQKYGRRLYGFAPNEMYIFVPCLNPQPPTSIAITDMSDGDDTQSLTDINADFLNSDVEIYKLSGFDDDIVKIESNVLISVLAGKVSSGVDWTVTPPSVNGTEKGSRYFVYASDSLTILPLEDDTTVDIIDLSDGDDTFSLLMNRFDIYTQRSVSEYGNPIVGRPGVSVYHNSNNLMDDDYIEIVSDKDILVYIGPVSDHRLEFADLSPSVSTGTFSQEIFTYAQNGGANDFQIFVYDKNHTVVKITSLTYSWGPGSGRDNFFDFTLDSDDFLGNGPWWWEWGGWGGNILHVQSNLPTSVFNGDFDGPSFGSFLSVINPPENLQYPDLQISSNDILFDPGSVIIEGSNVTIHATIHNVGELDVFGVKVSFYNGDPFAGGNLIGSNFTIPSLSIGDNISMNLTWLPPVSGSYDIYVAVDFPTPGMIIEIDETNNIAYRSLEVFAPRPPQLYIEAQDDDILLLWTHADTSLISHYLIHRSTSQIMFDFSIPWVDTSDDLANGVDPVDGQIIPKRISWNDTNAADELAPKEYYYIIRAVYINGKISTTSRTVGKYTRIFSSGISTFSLPLEPLSNMFCDNYTMDMNATYIKYMDDVTNLWVQHNSGDGNVNNPLLEVGRGFIVEFPIQTKYTFCGMPGAMILFYESTFGFNTNSANGDAQDLMASVNSTSKTVTLNWVAPVNMAPTDVYQVFMSTTRDGFWGNQGTDYELLSTLAYNELTYQDMGVASEWTQFYYMIVPLSQSTGKFGTSCYSIGVWTAGFDGHYDTFSLPLKPDSLKNVDWFCDEIEYTIGINYFELQFQEWSWHCTRMSAGAFDPLIEMGLGYQISTTFPTRFSFVGI
jgi:hypothetical protein